VLALDDVVDALTQFRAGRKHAQGLAESLVDGGVVVHGRRIVPP
jgi:hypothetical protein